MRPTAANIKDCFHLVFWGLGPARKASGLFRAHKKAPPVRSRGGAQLMRCEKPGSA